MSAASRSPEPRNVAERAYSLWEEEGRPHGRHETHWERAEQELSGAEKSAAAPVGDGQVAAKSAEPAPKKPAPKPAAAAAAAAVSAGEPAPAKPARARKSATAATAEEPAPKRTRAKPSSD
jgi:hypothetical protein